MFLSGRNEIKLGDLGISKELIFLIKAFSKGQKKDPPIPTNVSSSEIFSSVLSKYFNAFFLL
jgi:hypothetical protein